MGGWGASVLVSHRNSNLLFASLSHHLSSQSLLGSILCEDIRAMVSTSPTFACLRPASNSHACFPCCCRTMYPPLLHPLLMATLSCQQMVLAR